MATKFAQKIQAALKAQKGVAKVAKLEHHKITKAISKYIKG